MEAKEEKSVLTLMHDKSKLIFDPPDFMNFQSNLYPILKIEMICENETLVFKETEEYIINEFSLFIKSIVHSFDNFQHPSQYKATFKDQSDQKISVRDSGKIKIKIFKEKIFFKFIFFCKNFKFIILNLFFF